MSLNFCHLLFTGESKADEVPATPCSPPSSSSTSSSSSVTTQPAPRTDLLPPPPTDASPAAPVSRPPSPSPSPPPETEQPAASLSKEEEKEEEAQAATELKHRTPKNDLLEVDRFTICGNRIDWAAAAVTVVMNHSGQTDSGGLSARLSGPTAATSWVFIQVGGDTVSYCEQGHSLRPSRWGGSLKSRSLTKKTSAGFSQQERERGREASGWTGACVCVCVCVCVCACVCVCVCACVCVHVWVCVCV